MEKDDYLLFRSLIDKYGYAVLRNLLDQWLRSTEDRKFGF